MGVIFLQFTAKHLSGIIELKLNSNLFITGEEIDLPTTFVDNFVIFFKGLFHLLSCLVRATNYRSPYKPIFPGRTAA